MYLHVSGYRHLHFNEGEVSHAGTRSFKQLLFQQQLILIASEPSFHKVLNKKMQDIVSPQNY